MEENYFLRIERHPFIHAMPPKIKKHFYTLGTLKVFSSGENIVQEGEIIEEIYFIVSGTAEVRKQNDLLAVLHQGESIGLKETGFFSSSGERTATVSALSPLEVFAVGLAQLKKFFNLYPFLNQKMAQQNILYLKLNFIKKVLPFITLKNETLQKLLPKIEEITVSAGSVIFQQGQKGEVCYLIFSGEVNILLPHPDKSPETLAVLRRPQIFGEAALLLNTPRNATAMAATETTLWVIHQSVLNEVMAKSPEAVKRILLVHQKRCRPRKKEDIQMFHHQTMDKENITTLKHTEKIAYFQLTSYGMYLWALMDGKHSLKDIEKSFYKKFHFLDIRMILDFILDLKEAGFIYLDMKMPEKKAPPLLKFLIKLRKMMEFNFSFKNVDGWLTQSYKNFFWIFYTKPAHIIISAIAITGAVSFILHASAMLSILNIPGNIHIVFASFYANLILLILHELAHAYTTKAYGHQVHAFGIGWFWLSPIFFCDTSDMWLCPDKYSRMAVDAAGIYLNIILGSVAAVILLFLKLSPVSLFLWLFCLFNYLTAFSNLNPSLEFDGYYLLMDAMNKPNLRESAILMLVEKSPDQTILSKIKKYSKEIIYLTCCFLYLAAAAVMPYLLVNYVFTGMFGRYTHQIGILGSILAIIFSSLGIWAEYYAKRQSRFQQNF
jgi:CRP-like cAMP-binding protein/Zn-dependent protease